MHRLMCLVVALLMLVTAVCASNSTTSHNDNWAVLVSGSRFWFNYRHSANTLSFYRIVKEHGIPDSNIILMLPDDMACNPRNIYPGKVVGQAAQNVDLYGENVEVDYRGYQVTASNFMRVLVGRHSAETPASMRLNSGPNSNVLVYLTGHGGEDFFKFQDFEEITSAELADAFQQMYEQERYKNLLFVIDTCHAESMYSKITSPNIVSVASSTREEDSFSFGCNRDLGVSLIDRFSQEFLLFLENVTRESTSTIKDVLTPMTYQKLKSHHNYDDSLSTVKIDKLQLVDFFTNEKTYRSKHTMRHSLQRRGSEFWLGETLQPIPRSLLDERISDGHVAKDQSLLVPVLEAIKVALRQAKTYVGTTQAATLWLGIIVLGMLIS
eukprot:Clim_evm26s13 gene=Clim_evmTU26s13